ncbi:hypothetical protein [Pseudoxanthomonas suwonensis]|uniref:hypothetical protein n=1 Tax=Pseudoxanthomonas suwonensis TaxID=314722 RepID=UPI0004B898A4|nr:hypothetical protein [Pseudoxanthomonas suwonensis]
MTRADGFIVDGRLPDIEYRTDNPEEIICPRVTTRDGVPMVYMHNERDAPHEGFVPVSEFLVRLARREPNLAVTGYRGNGRQTTISFNKAGRATLSPRLQAWLSTLTAPLDGKSAAVVRFLASLAPLYMAEDRDGVWCARSLQDGTLVLPVDESDWDEERGTVRVYWQGDPLRTMEVDGDQIATLALERCVRLHGVGASEEAIAAELWFMARHFHVKTGCQVYLPQLPEPPDGWVRLRRKGAEIGQDILVNLISS